MITVARDTEKTLSGGTTETVTDADEVQVTDKTYVAIETDPWVPCGRCHNILPFTADPTERYFLGTLPACPRCNGVVDWWTSVLTAIREHFVFGQVLTMTGARALHCKVALRPGETLEVDLTAHGLPAEAHVVHLNLTPEGPVAPVLLHGNNAIDRPVGPRFFLYGRAIPPDSRARVPVNVGATWFVHQQDDTVERHLVHAARQYQSELFDGVIVPANIAVEAAVSPFLSAFLARYASPDRVKNMLEGGATYSHQLNVLLNVASDALGVPRLPEGIRGILNRQRKLRNEVVHEGSCTAQTRSDAAEHLAGSILFVRYVYLLQGRMRTAH